MASIASVFCLASFSISAPAQRCFHGVRLPPSLQSINLKANLSSSGAISSLRLIHHRLLYPIPPPKSSTFTVFAAKGYKMKTHKASAKRFRVTGNGKIVRRRAGKQHLLEKKSKKRKLRLSKMHAVDRSDYNNVMGALPYLKVNRKAT